MAIHRTPSLSDRLIKIIERNAEELAEGTVRKLQTDPRTPSYHNLSHDELYERGYAVYHDLGRWLWDKSTESVQSWYHDLGEMRRAEGVCLSEVLWALIVTKDQLLEYLAAWAMADSAVELYQQQEFDHLISHFYDRAIFYAAEGYERATVEKRRERTSSRNHTRSFWPRHRSIRESSPE
jgi:predicted CopG family antitoxin